MTENARRQLIGAWIFFLDGFLAGITGALVATGGQPFTKLGLEVAGSVGLVSGLSSLKRFLDAIKDDYLRTTSEKTTTTAEGGKIVEKTTVEAKVDPAVKS